MMNIRISAATIAAAVALTGTIVVAAETPLMLPVASAESNDFNPAHVVKINPAQDGAQYENELKAYQLISKIRHSYHSAGYDQKYDNYGNAAFRTVADLSENACYIAKARVALTILKMEGNAEARAIDTAKVGIDKEASEKALPLIEAARKEAFEKSFALEDGTDKTLYQARQKLFADGKSRLSDVVEEFAANPNAVPGQEYDAFSVTDWGIGEKYLTQARKDVGVTAEDLSVKVIDASATHTITAEQAKANGDENRGVAHERFNYSGDVGSTSIAPSTSMAPSTSASAEPSKSAEPTQPAQPAERGGLLGFLSKLFSKINGVLSMFFKNLSTSSTSS